MTSYKKGATITISSAEFKALAKTNKLILKSLCEEIYYGYNPYHNEYITTTGLANISSKTYSDPYAIMKGSFYYMDTGCFYTVESIVYATLKKPILKAQHYV